MPNPPEFLIVDNNRDNRFLLTKTLLRKFPAAKVDECDDAEIAVRMVAERDFTAVIVHRASDADGLSLVKMLRATKPDLLIVAVSGYDRKAEAFAAGANAFLHYDAWLSLGRVVEDVLRSANTPNPFKALAAEPTGHARADSGVTLREPAPRR